MRIDRIDLYHVAMPLIYPWRTAYGDDHVIESVLVRMQSGDAVGWGETSPLAAPTYSPEWAAGVFHVAKTRVWAEVKVTVRSHTARAAGQRRG
ncbi:MAG: hypothetical protein L0Y71_06960 [Gemmataceae bacterium]|nr:hypothetical protein [Gemmataceae bacterium]